MHKVKLRYVRLTIVAVEKQ